MKKILYSLLFIMFGFIFMSNVFAGSLSINANVSTAYIGNTIKATVNFNKIEDRKEGLWFE